MCEHAHVSASARGEARWRRCCSVGLQVLQRAPKMLSRFEAAAKLSARLSGLKQEPQREQAGVRVVEATFARVGMHVPLRSRGEARPRTRALSAARGEATTHQRFAAKDLCRGVGLQPEPSLQGAGSTIGSYSECNCRTVAEAALTPIHTGPLKRVQRSPDLAVVRLVIYGIWVAPRSCFVSPDWDGCSRVRPCLPACLRLGGGQRPPGFREWQPAFNLLPRVECARQGLRGAAARVLRAARSGKSLPRQNCARQFAVASCRVHATCDMTVVELPPALYMRQYADSVAA